jgi:hypothetical protein
VILDDLTTLKQWQSVTLLDARLDVDKPLLVRLILLYGIGQDIIKDFAIVILSALIK